MDSDREITARYDAGIEARVERAAPAYDQLDADRVLGRVLEGVLDRPVEPVRAGRYVLLDALGQGGLGTVYAAWDPEIDRRVAIKLIRADTADGIDDVQARLRREAQTLAKVVHPNVVTVYDVGTFRDQLFLAMELVPGHTLRRWLAEAERPWAEIRDVLVQAGRGLAAVHDAGLVQRDFKPQNVIVGAGVVKVLDFGLARAFASTEVSTAKSILPHASSSLVDVQITMPGLFAGTPAYMAPEQCRPGPIDARADQFAFCVTAFEALFGERPFPDDTRARLTAIADGRIPPPPTARAVPGWLHAAIVRGLANDPAARHPSMNHLLAAMQRDLRRQRSGWAIAAAATVSALATAAAITWWPRPIAASDRAELDRLVAEVTLAAAEHRFVYPSPDDPKRPTAYSSTVALEHLGGPIAETADERAAELRQQLAAQLEQLGDEYTALPGGAPFAADFYAAALLFDPENAGARAHAYLTPPELADLRARAAELDFATEELIAAEPLAALAEPDREARGAKLERVRARAGSATTLARIDRLVDATRPKRAPTAATVPAVVPTPVAVAPTRPTPTPEQSRPAEAVPADDDEADVDELVKRGLAALRQRKLDEAGKLLHRAAAKRRSGPVLVALSTLHFELGEYPRAVEYGELAVRAAPKSAAARLALGDAYFKVLRYDEARTTYLAAQKLESSAAAGRLRRLDEKLGK